MNLYKTSVPNPVLFSPHLPKMDSRYVVLGGIFATLHRKLYASELRELDVRQRRIAGPGAHVNWNEPWHDVCFLLDPLFLRVVCLERFFSDTSCAIYTQRASYVQGSTAKSKPLLR